MTLIKCTLTFFVALHLVACGPDGPVSAQRYASVDAIIHTIAGNVGEADGLTLEFDIDHSRLAAAAGETLPPARVLMVSAPELEAKLLAENQRVGVDLPFKVLAFEHESGESKTVYNNFDYLVSRYKLAENSALRQSYDNVVAQTLVGIDQTAQSKFDNDVMQPDGLITIDSVYDFDATMRRVYRAITAQDDTVVFGEINYQEQAVEVNMAIRPTTLILFGGPAPGAKAMNGAATLGLDAFCQKFLVWEDAKGGVHLSFNDLLAIADRQDVSKNIPLRVIRFRLSKAFTAALAE